MRRYILILLFLILFLPGTIFAATLSISPTTGTFAVGSTFDVSLVLDTNGKSVNALAISLQFPQDMLQVVSPSTGQSIVGVWTSTPKFNNSTGRIDLQGGIPGGITTSGGFISTITFRVKSIGEGIVKFLDSSKVLLNDGLGTNALSQSNNAVYNFKLPAPAGPSLISETNPDQATWYSTRTVSFRFINETSGIEGYSYVLSDEPTTIPDDVNEGIKNSVSYSNLSDGIHYFHIKSLRDKTWGGVTHYAVKIDTTPPADFKIDIAPGSRTTSQQPIIQFITTDTLSGMDHYELKIIPLSGPANPSGEKADNFFTEEVSPYIPPKLALGTYDVIVRAYDKSNNYKEIVQRLFITNSIFSFISSEGIKLSENFVISWFYFFSSIFVILVILFIILLRMRRWHRTIHEAHTEKRLPRSVAEELEELKRYRAKYGTKAFILLLIFSSFFFSQNIVKAEDLLAPPLISTFSKSISNEEIFYVGGRTDLSGEKIILYLQNLLTGETFSKEITSDEKGDWLYYHDTFLSPGQYLIWAQSKLGAEISPPGPQIKMMVSRTAAQFGGSRISFETMYLFISIFLLLAVLGLVIFIVYHYRMGSKKHRKLQKEIRATEESLKRGFAVLRRDIESELAIIRRAGLQGEISEQEKIREKELLSDLNTIQGKIGKEIWELNSNT